MTAERQERESFAVVFSITDVTEDPVSLAVSMEALVERGTVHASPPLTELLIDSNFEITLTTADAPKHELERPFDGTCSVAAANEFDSSKSATVFVNEPLDGDWTFMP